MKKLFFIFSVFTFFGINAQIVINDNKSIISLVQNLKGTGVEISNITYDCEIGSSNPFGEYTDTSGVTGLSKGMILTTGTAKNAVGPNNKSGQGIQNSVNEKYDDDLLGLVNLNQSNGEFYDVCKVEFDISIYSDELSFKYVFGSEEYPEFEDSFHDLFGFFINGPGINGTKNLALIPGTNDPVSVSTVNSTINSNYYTSNGDGIVPPYSPIMQYDGYTKVLTAKTSVQPCETYHIKLIIADEGDGIYDSGIFLESGSFSSTEERISQRFEYPQFNYAIEGCNKGYFILSRIGGEKNNLSQEIELIYSISGTAINGTDYTYLTDTVYIPSFTDFVEIEIDAFIDSLIESDETITISIINDCPALPSTFTSTMVIKDYFEFEVSPSKVCLGYESQLNNPVKTNPYQIVWDSNQNLSCYECTSPTTLINESSFFKYTLTDPVSGCVSKNSVKVNVNIPPKAYFTHSLSDFYTNLDIFFQNYSERADTFHWDFGDGNTSEIKDPMHTYLNENNSYNNLSFEVSLWAYNKETGCEDTYKEIITITEPFLIPNIITPNEDSENDAFTIKGIQPDRWNMLIFNRWGRKVLDTEHYNNRWKGDDVPDGVYYYNLINRNKDKKYKGWLQIIR